MTNILFVCTGNTCRSPMAEALLKEKTKKLHVKSAGIAAFSAGAPANEQTIKILQEKGIAINHEVTALNPELLEWADLILTMTKQHKKTILLTFPQAEGKIYTFKQYVAGDRLDKLSADDISDPFGGTDACYRKTLHEIEQLVDKLVEKLCR